MRTDEKQCLLMTVDSRSDADDLRTRDCLCGLILLLKWGLSRKIISVIIPGKFLC